MGKTPWTSQWGDGSKNVFRQRLKEESEKNWRLFVRLRDLLTVAFDLDSVEAWTEVASFFPIGGREYTTEDAKQFRGQLVVKYSRRLEIESSNDGTTIRAEGELSPTAAQAMADLPEGQGPVTMADVNWALNRAEFESIDVREAPDRRVVALWRSARRDRGQFEKNWAQKLLDTKDPEADAKRQTRDERAEAEVHAAACQQLVDLVRGCNTKHATATAGAA